MDLASIHRVLEEGGATAGEKLRRFFGSLEEEFRVAINLHDLVGISQIDADTRAALEPYLYHNNAFCNAVKKQAAGLAACSFNKALLCRRFQRHESPFYGVCYLGIEELRYPIRWNGRLLGFLCVGQFCTDEAAAHRRLEHYAPQLGLDVDELKRQHRRVARPLDLDLRRLGARIGFLADYLALLHARFLAAGEAGVDAAFDAKEHSGHYFVARTKAFVWEHYAQPLTLAVLAANAYCSPTYLSALFRRVEGRTLTEAIREVRLLRAKALLDTTSWNVTEVAFAVGFHDSNYFSRAFRQAYGLSPTAYRNS